MHLSETAGEETECQERCGLTSTQLLDCHRVFEVPSAAAHCIYLSREDMGLLARQEISAVHCPVANLKLASGVAPVAEMVKAGMNVALGTDSAACNNTLDLFEEMKAAALAAKMRAGDPAALPPPGACYDGHGVRRPGPGTGGGMRHVEGWHGCRPHFGGLYRPPFDALP